VTFSGLPNSSSKAARIFTVALLSDVRTESNDIGRPHRTRT
jgi:hypothetical protein